MLESDCDCKSDPTCASTSRCEAKEGEGAAEALWVEYSGILTGVLTILGFFAYRFTQALPAIIRWPIRLICSLTGLSSTWSWISRFFNTIRGLQTFVKWLGCIWRVLIGFLTDVRKCLAFITKFVQNLPERSSDQTNRRECFRNSTSVTTDPSDPGLRLILMGTEEEDQSLLGNILLGCHKLHGTEFMGAWDACQWRRAVVDGREVTVVRTPDLLGSSLEAGEVAKETLRSLQLASPGPHAFLLVLRDPGTNGKVKALENLLELMGEEALSHVLLVLSHAECLSGSCAPTPVSEQDPGSFGKLLSMLDQRTELLSNWPTGTLAQKSALGRRLLDRVARMKASRGHYIHELQRREELIRDELLSDMAFTLKKKLEDGGSPGGKRD